MRSLHHITHAPRVIIFGMVLMVIVVTSCSTSTPVLNTSTATPTSPFGFGKGPTPPTTPTRTPSIVRSPLPAFSDWRVAYMGVDNRIHAVTLDGKTDVAGATLPFGPAGTPPNLGGGIENPGFGPDGRTLAYVTDQGFIIMNVASNQIPQIIVNHNSDPDTLQWAPDGHSLVLFEIPNGFFLAHINDGSIVPTPGNPFLDPAFQGNASLDVWFNDTEVLFTRLGGTSNQTRYQYYAFNVTSGKSRLIAAIPIPTPSPPYGVEASVLPNRANILYFFTSIQGDSITPTVSLFDIGSSTNIPLPNLTKLNTPEALGLQNFRWRPGTQIAALCTGSPVNHNLKDWLVDPANDKVTPLPSIGFPVGWSPDGKTLILSSDRISEKGGGPYTITALTFQNDGSMTQTVLTTTAMNFNFIGFVRTATP